MAGDQVAAIAAGNGHDCSNRFDKGAEDAATYGSGLFRKTRPDHVVFALYFRSSVFLANRRFSGHIMPAVLCNQYPMEFPVCQNRSS